MAKTTINFNLINEIVPRNFDAFISTSDETFKYHVWERGIIKGGNIAVPAQRVFPHTQVINRRPCKVASIIVGVYDPNWKLKTIDVMALTMLTARTYGPRKDCPDTIGVKESSKKGLFLPERAEDIPVIDGGLLALKRVSAPVKGLVDLCVSEPSFFEAGSYVAFGVAQKAIYGGGQLYELTPEGKIKIGTKRYQTFKRVFPETLPEGLEKIQVVPIPGATEVATQAVGLNEIPFQGGFHYLEKRSYVVIHRIFFFSDQARTLGMTSATRSCFNECQRVFFLFNFFLNFFIMAKIEKVLKNAKPVTGLAKLTDEQAEFVGNRQAPALTIGMTICVPAQIVHLEDTPWGAGKFVFCNFYKDGSYVETKSVALSQFTLRTYGPDPVIDGKLVPLQIEAYPDVDRQGRSVVRAALQPTDSNIDTPLLQGVVEREGSKTLVIREAAAYAVGKGDIHNMSDLVKEAHGGYSVAVQSADAGLVKLKKRRLPSLTKTAVLPGMATLPSECAPYLV